jgi:hypothetical protein
LLVVSVIRRSSSGMRTSRSKARSIRHFRRSACVSCLFECGTCCCRSPENEMRPPVGWMP